MRVQATDVCHPIPLIPTTNTQPPALLARIIRLRTFLSQFEYTTQIRTFLYLQTLTPNVCIPCNGARLAPGSCGPTCALLNPNANVVYKRSWAPPWIVEVKKDYQIYRLLEQDILEHGDTAGAERVEAWEAQVNQLEERDRVPSEVAEKLKKAPAAYKGLNLEWTFEKAWGKGKGEYRTVPPEVGGPEVVESKNLEKRESDQELKSLQTSGKRKRKAREHGLNSGKQRRLA